MQGVVVNENNNRPEPGGEGRMSRKLDVSRTAGCRVWSPEIWRGYHPVWHYLWQDGICNTLRWSGNGVEVNNTVRRGRRDYAMGSKHPKGNNG
jgi:hypothetical protein